MIRKPARPWLKGLLLACIAMTLTACGGDRWHDDWDDHHSGGGDRGEEVSTGTPPGDNVLRMVIDGGPTGRAVNVPYVSLTICTPGSATACRTVDHILVDTGSTGLRIMASALTPQVTPAPYNNAAGEPLAECLGFVDGSSVWGRLRRVDVMLGSERVSALPIQVIGDVEGAALPSSCYGEVQNTPNSFGANGVIGISTFLQDCGPQCVTSALNQYYRCPPSGCVPTTMALADQLANPVSRRAQDNNGVMVTLPNVPRNGASAAVGALILGINTRPNNQVPATSPILGLSSTGDLTVAYNGQNLTESFFDTGSNYYFFNDSSIPTCSQTGWSRFYCPRTDLARNATAIGVNGTSTAISFRLYNVYDTYQRNSANDVFDGFAATNPLPNSFDFGAPFFFGRRVFTAFEGQPGLPNNVAGVNGPWIAF